MNNLIMGALSFTLCFIGRLAIYLFKNKKKNKKKKNKSGISTEMQYLINKFNLKESKLNRTSIASIISLLDALIISGTLVLVISITDKVIFELLLGLVLVIIFIFLVYEVFGRILVKKGYDQK